MLLTDCWCLAMMSRFKWSILIACQGFLCADLSLQTELAVTLVTRWRATVTRAVFGLAFPEAA